MNYLNNYHCITMEQQNKAAKMTARISEPSGRATIPDGLQRSENDPFLEIHQAVSKEAIRREALIGLFLCFFREESRLKTANIVSQPLMQDRKIQYLMEEKRGQSYSKHRSGSLRE